MKITTILMLLLLITTSIVYAAAKLSDADIINGANIRDTKIYVTANGINQTLDQAIATGQLVSATAQLDTNFAVKNATDLTKQFRVALAGGSTMTGVTLSFSQTADSFYSFPDGTTTVVGHDRNQVLTNKTMDYTLNTFLNFPASGGGSGINEISGDVTSGGPQVGISNAFVTVTAVASVPAYKIKNQSDFIDQGSSAFSTSKLVSTNAAGVIETNISASSTIDGVPAYRLDDVVDEVDGASSELSVSKIVSTNASGEIKTRIVSSFVEGITTASIVSATSLVSTATAQNSSSTIVSRNAFGSLDGNVISANSFVGALTGSSTTLSSVLDISHGGTGAANTLSAAASLFPDMNHKGDLLVYTANPSSPFERLPVGVAGQVLTAAPVTSWAGVAWQVPSGGSGGSAQVSEYMTYQFSGAFNGSTNSRVLRFDTANSNIDTGAGVDFTCSDSATLGFSCLLAKGGLYSVSSAVLGATAAVDIYIGVQRASSIAQGSTNLTSLTDRTKTMCANRAGAISNSALVACTFRASANDLIWIQESDIVTVDNESYNYWFHITKVGD